MFIIHSSILQRIGKKKMNFDLDNAQTQCLLTIVCDVSWSMTEDGRWRNMVDGINRLFQNLKNDSVALDAMNISILDYSDDVYVGLPFTSLEDINKPAEEYIRRPIDNTVVTPALQLAINSTNEAMQIGRDNGVKFYRPHIIVFTDGYFHDDDAAAYFGLNNIIPMEKNGDVTVIPVAVDGANVDLLSQISSNPVVKIDSDDFGKFFEFMSRSMSSLSRTGIAIQATTENVQSGINAWQAL